MSWIRAQKHLREERGREEGGKSFILGHFMFEMSQSSRVGMLSSNIN